MKTVGVVIIGRNEGLRLERCLQSVRASAAALAEDHAILLEMIYVDSGSTDDSVALAERLGAAVVPLDMALPFTAGRARNAGARALFARHPEMQYLQFLDGDTELNHRWMAHAISYLHHHPRIAVVSGRLRERFPEATVYNLLADMEWDAPAGPAEECGGNMMIRAAVFLHVGGFSENFIAGEEPDLAARIRKQRTRAHRHNAPIASVDAFEIVRLGHDMARHDLAMTRFSQWWRRTMRSGHALAQLAHTHGGRPLYFYRRAWRSTVFWAVLAPLTILIAAAWSPWILCLFPLIYGTLAARIFRYRLRRGDDRDSAAVYAFFTTLGKLPQLLGMIRFYRNLWSRRPSRIIEYKSPARTDPAAANPSPAAIGNT